uniref:(northern house mosquito) hypothetical protein n=1 Tax=Culex pipiens TaxID=7175 RepID=A0A8D8IUJ2_CULPI
MKCAQSSKRSLDNEDRITTPQTDSAKTQKNRCLEKIPQTQPAEAVKRSTPLSPGSLSSPQDASKLNPNVSISTLPGRSDTLDDPLYQISNGLCKVDFDRLIKQRLQQPPPGRSTLSTAASTDSTSTIRMYRIDFDRLIRERLNAVDQLNARTGQREPKFSIFRNVELIAQSSQNDRNATP